MVFFFKCDTIFTFIYYETQENPKHLCLKLSFISSILKKYKHIFFLFVMILLLYCSNKSLKTYNQLLKPLGRLMLNYLFVFSLNGKGNISKLRFLKFYWVNKNRFSIFPTSYFSRVKTNFMDFYVSVVLWSIQSTSCLNCRIFSNPFKYYFG